MAFFNPGERKKRPGVYMRIVNRGTDTGEAAAIVVPTPIPPINPPEPSGNLLLADSRGVLLKTSDGYYLAVKN